MYEIEIRNLPQIDIAALLHRGAYDAASETYDKLDRLCDARDLWRLSRGLIMVFCDDPDQVAMADLRSYAGIEVAPGLDVSAPLVTLTLPAGRHAVLHHTGPYTGLRAAYDQIYTDWFPTSGEAPGKAWAFERYLNTPLNTAPEDLRTDICIPLK